MYDLEIAIRLIVIGQELLLALLFAFGNGSKSARISGVLLLVSVAAHLVTADPTLREAVHALFPLAALLSIALPYFLWSFARTLFDAPLPNALILISFVAIGLAVWVIFLAEDQVSQSLFDVAFTGSRLVSLVIVGNTLWMALSGRPDDLMEQRRQFRTVFVALVSLLVIAVLITELVIGNYAPPGWLSMLSVLLIGGMTMGLAIPMLKLNEDFFPAHSQWCCAETEDSKKTLAAADRVLHDKLIVAMEGGAYRQTSLTISALAGDLKYPEHQLRKLINQHLRFRNFSAFLNSYRIDEAMTRLGDPENARTPVLTIALNLGYGSLGPFNRAFKAMTGMTPTEYREQAIPADSE
jgi:AraC-like DNA-binding protein